MGDVGREKEILWLVAYVGGARAERVVGAGEVLIAREGAPVSGEFRSRFGGRGGRRGRGIGRGRRHEGPFRTRGRVCTRSGSWTPDRNVRGRGRRGRGGGGGS